MVPSVSCLLVLLLYLFSADTQENIFNVVPSPRSTTVTLVEGDNVFISFAVLTPDLQLSIQWRIVKYFKNDSDETQRFVYFSVPEDGALRLNKTQLEGNSSTHWVTTGVDGMEYKEYIVRVAYGHHLVDVDRLNLQFELINAQNINQVQTVTFNIMLASSATAEVESSKIESTSATIQPMATSDPILVTSDFSVLPTSTQAATSSPGRDVKIRDSESSTPTTATLVSMSHPGLPSPIPTPSSTSPRPSDPTPSSTSVYGSERPSSSSQSVTAGVSSTVEFIIAVLIGTNSVLLALYIQCRKNKAKDIPDKQLTHSTSQTKSSGTASTVIPNEHRENGEHGDLWKSAKNDSN